MGKRDTMSMFARAKSTAAPRSARRKRVSESTRTISVSAEEKGWLFFFSFSLSPPLMKSWHDAPRTARGASMHRRKERSEKKREDQRELPFLFFFYLLMKREGLEELF